MVPAPHRTIPLLLVGLLGVPAEAQEAATPPQAESAPPARAIPLRDHAALTAELGRIAREHADVASVVAVGTSRAGRRIDALRLSRGEPPPGKPAILVVAALDGPLAWTSGLVLDHARALVADGALLERATVYLVPRANPDACEARFATPLAEVEATGTGVDTDRDGQSGEDGPADVDGDGVVAWMRVPDPDGAWTEDPTDPRALVKADATKGQRGRWKLVREARDADGDEEAGEDAPRDAVVNRNFPQGWREHAPESGRYATEEPEARALCDFVLLHKDVALVLTYGRLDNLAEKPKGKDDRARQSRSPLDGIPGADADLLAELGRRWKAVGTSGRPEGDDAGTFQAWAQAQRGLWTLNLAPWSVPLDAKPKEEEAKAEPGADEGKKPKKKDDEAPKPSDDAKRLAWFDAHPEVNGFVPWRAFHHPELGDVEIGGFRPYALVEPPEGERAAIADATLQFLTGLGDVLPRLSIAEARAQDLGGGTWRVTAAVVNDGFLPLQSAQARRARSQRPARVALELPRGATLLGGRPEELVSELAGSGGRHELVWLVRADSLDGLAVVLDTDSAGAARRALEVKR